MTAILTDERGSALTRADRSDRIRALVVPPVGVVAAVAMGLLAGRSPLLCLGAMLSLGIAAVVWWRPAVAAYLIVGVTPLVVGIDRGRLVPQMRVNEALVCFLVGVLCVRAAVRLRPGDSIGLVLDPVSRSFVWFALASSVVPIIFMVARGRAIDMEDLTYAAVIWKFIYDYRSGDQPTLRNSTTDSSGSMISSSPGVASIIRAASLASRMLWLIARS